MRSDRLVPRCAMLVGLLFTLVLAGCVPAAKPTAVATLGPPLPPPTTPTPLASAQLPTATVALPTAKAVQATATPTATTAVRPVEGLSLTVLHTNDVYGYIDPCG